MAKKKKQPLLDDAVPDLSIAINELESEYIQMPNALYKAGIRVAQCRSEVSRLALNLSVLKGELAPQLSEEVRLTTGRAPSVDMLRGLVISHHTTQEADLKLIGAQERLRRAEALFDGLRAKKMMLVSLGADRRKATGPGDTCF